MTKSKDNVYIQEVRISYRKSSKTQKYENLDVFFRVSHVLCHKGGAEMDVSYDKEVQTVAGSAQHVRSGPSNVL